MTTLDDLVAAWRRWDRAPGSLRTTSEKEQAIRDLGLDALRLHDRVAELRRAGMPLEDALRQAVAEQEAGS